MLAGMSAAALVILLAAMIFPALPEAAQAVEGGRRCDDLCDGGVGVFGSASDD